MDTLYHYCSTETFLSIISNQSIWLSSMSLSNDSSEGRFIGNLLLEMAGESGLHQEVLDILRDSTNAFHRIYDGLGFCLSANGDLLSQWRGYAKDGAGMSIGFSKDYLQWFSSTAIQHSNGMMFDEVKYNPSQHEAILRPVIEKLKSQFGSEPLGRRRGLLSNLLIPGTNIDDADIDAQWASSHRAIWNTGWALFKHLYFCKSDAFSEENEWRLLTHWISEQDQSAFRVARDRLIPYKSMKLREVERHPIKKVYLGPKQTTPVSVISAALKSFGFGEVEIEFSKASYR